MFVTLYKEVRKSKAIIGFLILNLFLSPFLAAGSLVSAAGAGTSEKFIYMFSFMMITSIGLPLLGVIIIYIVAKYLNMFLFDNKRTNISFILSAIFNSLICSTLINIFVDDSFQINQSGPLSAIIGLAIFPFIYFYLCYGIGSLWKYIWHKRHK